MPVPTPLIELGKTLSVLVADIQESEALAAKGLPSARRQYVRSVFAMMDAVGFAAKQIALHAATRFDVALSTAEQALCREESYDVDERGRPVTRQAFAKWKGAFRFSLDVLARSYEIEHRFDFGKTGWEALQRSQLVRNRLVHPKSSADLSVTDEEVKDAEAGLAWFRAEFTDLANAIAARLEARANRLEQEGGDDA